jgi:hypothetical protein
MAVVNFEGEGTETRAVEPAAARAVTVGKVPASGLVPFALLGVE